MWDTNYTWAIHFHLQRCMTLYMKFIVFKIIKYCGTATPNIKGMLKNFGQKIKLNRVT